MCYCDVPAAAVGIYIASLRHPVPSTSNLLDGKRCDVRSFPVTLRSAHRHPPPRRPFCQLQASAARFAE